MITEQTAIEVLWALRGAKDWLPSFAPNQLLELIETTLTKARKDFPNDPL